ncbi:11881_t:CDS:2 [Funneliformis geosporum]|uniref:11881_t:CDS:1 n=1 Tax=Funneliformis geosporum TaxID=1117311 RepID=A0A9W4WYJ7_9GLOM|nr:11881_t:CDS:2 [Funneliformis geosporum]
MDESMKVNNLRTLHQIIEDVLRETPDKDNKSVQCFISRMRDRHIREEADAKRLIKKGLTLKPYLYQIPESGKRFEYVVVENNLSERVGDKIEYPEVAR